MLDHASKITTPHPTKITIGRIRQIKRTCSTDRG